MLVVFVYREELAVTQLADNILLKLIYEVFYLALVLRSSNSGRNDHCTVVLSLDL